MADFTLTADVSLEKGSEAKLQSDIDKAVSKVNAEIDVTPKNIEKFTSTLQNSVKDTKIVIDASIDSKQLNESIQVAANQAKDPVLVAGKVVLDRTANAMMMDSMKNIEVPIKPTIQNIGSLESYLGNNPVTLEGKIAKLYFDELAKKQVQEELFSGTKNELAVVGKNELAIYQSQEQELKHIIDLTHNLIQVTSDGEFIYQPLINSTIAYREELQRAKEETWGFLRDIDSNAKPASTIFLQDTQAAKVPDIIHLPDKQQILGEVQSIADGAEIIIRDLAEDIKQTDEDLITKGRPVIEHVKQLRKSLEEIESPKPITVEMVDEGFREVRQVADDAQKLQGIHLELVDSTDVQRMQELNEQLGMCEDIAVKSAGHKVTVTSKSITADASQTFNNILDRAQQTGQTVSQVAQQTGQTVSQAAQQSAQDVVEATSTIAKSDKEILNEKRENFGVERFKLIRQTAQEAEPLIQQLQQAMQSLRQEMEEGNNIPFLSIVKENIQSMETDLGRTQEIIANTINTLKADPSLADNNIVQQALQNMSADPAMFKSMLQYLQDISSRADVAREAVAKLYDSNIGKEEFNFKIKGIDTESITAAEKLSTLMESLSDYMQVYKDRQDALSTSKFADEIISEDLNLETLEQRLQRIITLYEELKNAKSAGTVGTPHRNLATDFDMDNPDLPPQLRPQYEAMTRELKFFIQAMQEAYEATKVSNIGDALAVQNEKAIQSLNTLSAAQQKLNTALSPENLSRIQDEEVYESMSRRIEELNERIQQLVAQILQAKAEGNIDIGINEGDIAAAVNDVNSLNREFNNTMKAQIGEKINEAVQKILNGLRNMYAATAQIVANLNTIATSIYGLVDKYIARIRTLLTTVKTGISKIASTIKSWAASFKNLLTNAKKTRNEVTNTNKQFNQGLRFLIQYGLGLRSLYFLARRIRTFLTSAFMEVYKTADKYQPLKAYHKAVKDLKVSIEQLRYTIFAAFEPLVTTIVPYLTKAIEWITSKLSALGQIIASLFGRTTYLKVNRKAMEKIVDLQDKSAKKEKDKAKSKNKQLSSLDKINNLSSSKLKKDEKDKDKTPKAKDMFTEVPIEDRFKKIADAIRDFFNKLLAPIKAAWDRWKDYVISSWKYAVEEIKKLFKVWAAAFWKVWQEPETQKIFENIFHIVGLIGKIVGTIAKKLRIASEYSDNAYRILKAIRDIILTITNHLVKMFQSWLKFAERLDLRPLLTAIADWLTSINKVADVVWGIFEDINDNITWLVQYVLEQFIPAIFNRMKEFNELPFWDTLRENLQRVWVVAEKVLEKIGDALLVVWDIIMDIFGGIGNWLATTNFDPVLDKIMEWADTLRPTMEAIRNIFMDLGNLTIKPLFDNMVKDGGIVEQILDKFKAFNEWLQDDETRKKLQDFFQNTLYPALEKLQELLPAIVDRILEIIKAIVEGRSTGNPFLDGFINQLKWIMDILKNMPADQIVGWIESFMTLKIFVLPLLSALSTVLTILKGIGGLAGALRPVFKILGNILGLVLRLVLVVGKAVLTKLPGLISSLGIKLKGLLSIVGTKLSSLLSTVGTKLGSLLSTIGTKLSSVFSTLGTKLSGFFGSTLPAYLSNVGAAMTGPISELGALTGAELVGALATTVLGGIAAFFGGAEIGKAIGAAIFPDDAELYEHYQGISGTVELVKDAAISAADAIAIAWDSSLKTVQRTQEATALENTGVESIQSKIGDKGFFESDVDYNQRINNEKARLQQEAEMQQRYTDAYTQALERLRTQGKLTEEELASIHDVTEVTAEEYTNLHRLNEQLLEVEQGKREKIDDTAQAILDGTAAYKEHLVIGQQMAEQQVEHIEKQLQTTTAQADQIDVVTDSIEQQKVAVDETTQSLDNMAQAMDGVESTNVSEYFKSLTPEQQVEALQLSPEAVEQLLQSVSVDTEALIAQGQDYANGISEGMVKGFQEYDFSAATESISTGLETAFTGEGSITTRMSEIGALIAGGILEGINSITAEDTAAACQNFATQLNESLNTAFVIEGDTSQEGLTIGTALMQGIITGFTQQLELWNTTITQWLENTKINITTFIEELKVTLINSSTEMFETLTLSFNTFWSNLKQLFNTMVSGVETLANGVVTAINTMLQSLNALDIEVPDWAQAEVGTGRIGFNIPTVPRVSIPRLAKGAVIPPSASNFMAMLGDNNKESEIVSPLSTMEQAFKNALAQADLGGNIQTAINIDGQQLFTLMQEYGGRYKKRMGVSAF